MKKILIGTILILLGPQVFSLAGEPAPKNPDLASLGKSWEESRDKYRDALKERRDFIQNEINQKESLLEKEDNGHERKSLLAAMRGLLSERDDLNSKIREINATDVVKFSTGRDKILSALTGQARA